MELTSLEPRTYLFATAKTTFRDIPRTIQTLMAPLQQAAAQGKAHFQGPPVLRYLIATANLNEPFTLEVGFPVSADTQPPPGLQVRTETQPFRCAAVTFVGPISMIDKAYDRLIAATTAAGVKLTDESRETYLNSDGPDSGADSVLVAVGVH